MKLFLAFAFTLVVAGHVIAADADTKEIRALVPTATAMPLADFDRLATSRAAPKASDLQSQPLTLILMSVKIEEKDERLDGEFRYLGDRPPKPAELAKELTRYVRGAGRLRVALGPVTMVHADRIKEFTCKVDGEEATGKISFAVPDLYAGQVDYVARRVKGKWQIEEFALPIRQIRVTRSENETWVRDDIKRQR